VLEAGEGLDNLVKRSVLLARYPISTESLFSKEKHGPKYLLRGGALEVGVTISMMAEEMAVLYRKMSERQGSLRRAGLLRLTSELLEDLALEAIRGEVSEISLERLAVVERLLRLNGLPSSRLGRLIRVARKYVSPKFEYYPPPHVEISNNMLS